MVLDQLRTELQAQYLQLVLKKIVTVQLQLYGTQFSEVPSWL